MRLLHSWANKMCFQLVTLLEISWFGEWDWVNWEKSMSYCSYSIWENHYMVFLSSKTCLRCVSHHTRCHWQVLTCCPCPYAIKGNFCIRHQHALAAWWFLKRNGLISDLSHLWDNNDHSTFSFNHHPPVFPVPPSHQALYLGVFSCQKVGGSCGYI